MICTLTARRIKPGHSDEFLERFESSADDMPPEMMERWNAVYACRDTRDEDVILTFGMFDGTLDELRQIMSSGARDQQLESFGDIVEEELIDGSFEVIKNFVTEAGRV
jgi:hypothetical protein